MRALLSALLLVLAVDAFAQESGSTDPAEIRAQVVKSLAVIETTIAEQDTQLAELLDRIDVTEDATARRQLRAAADRMTAALDGMDEVRSTLESQLEQLDAILAAQRDADATGDGKRP